MAETKEAPAKNKPQQKPWSQQTSGEKVATVFGYLVVVAIIGGIVAYLVYSLFFYHDNSGSKPDKANATASQTQQQAPAKPKTPEEQLKQAATNAIGKDKIRNVDVVKQVDGGYGVFVEFNADDNLSTGLLKDGIKKDMSDVYIALYHNSGQDVRQASVAAYMPVTDTYGNTSDAVVWKSVLKKDEASKINYNETKAVLELNIIPNVWTTTVLNASFR